MQYSGLPTCLALALLCVTPQAFAANYSFSGHLDDSGNAALMGSDLGAPQFTDDAAVANNVALYTFNVTTGGAVNFTSLGFAGGGVDPYFSLFSGSGNAANFIGSNYVQAFSTGGDFAFSFVLAPGDYTLTLGSFANMSIAENAGIGSLGDGFSGLGQPGALGSTFYKLNVGVPDRSNGAPEPGTLLLLGIAGVVFGIIRYYLSRRR
ncbi:MAG: DVUA0089 family protein [Proteobacteria bacterium]|nr:DVUA0089 family protein [Pseudomonadota bacterium]RTL24000.1 MAG: PEP-CTERM sorting domain-containing protein [Rhodocyclaceae bacterium]